MRRTYVPIYQDKKRNSQIYFDYELNEFFTTPEQKKSSFTYLSGFVGIILYSYFKNIVFDSGINSLHLVFLCMFLGTIIGFISIKLLMSYINKNLEKNKIPVNPTKEQLREYINEGKKQSRTLLFVIVVVFVLSLTGWIFILLMHSVLFFSLSIVMWAASILTIWAIRPIKKIQIYNQLEREL